MQYNSLHHLISKSSSSRSFFLALPAEAQRVLHKENLHIHTQLELRLMAEAALSLLRKDLI